MLYKLAKKDDKAKRYANAAFLLSVPALAIGYPYVKSNETAIKSLEKGIEEFFGVRPDLSDFGKPSILGKAVKGIGLASIPLGLYAAYRSYKSPDKKDAHKYYRGAAIVGGLSGLSYLARHKYDKEVKKALEGLKHETDIEKLEKLSQNLITSSRLRELSRWSGHAGMATAGGLALIGLANQLGARKKHK